MANGFITLHRQILDWEWYKNTNTKVLFLHLLLKANYKDMSFEGRKIYRGQLVTSLPSLSAEIGQSVKQVRGSLEHLISTGEVASEKFPRYRVITIVKYDDYQIDGSLMGSQRADEWAVKGQSDGQSKGSQRAVSKQYNNSNKETKGKNNKSGGTVTRFIPPTPEDVRAFCQSDGIQIDADRFCNYYASKGWKIGRDPMKDWQAAVRNWALRDREPARAPVKQMPAQNFEQRDYADYDPMAELAKEIAAMKGGTL